MDLFYVDTTPDPSLLQKEPDFIPLKTKRNKKKKKALPVEEELDDELVQDYIENTDAIEHYFHQYESDQDSAIDALVYEELMENEDEVDYDSDSQDLDDFLDDKMMDHLTLESEDNYDLLANESASDDENYLKNEISDSDDIPSMDEERRNFEGASSSWTPRKQKASLMDQEKTFNRLNGDFDQFNRLNAHESLSKSAQRKLAKRELKTKRKNLRQQAQNREEQSMALAEALSKRNAAPELVKFLEKMNQEIRTFVNTNHESTLLPPMPGKVKWSGLPKMLLKATDASPKSFNNPHFRAKKPTPRKSMPQDKEKPKMGEVVGSKAKPLDDANIGHRMLKAMGWTPGTSLGQSTSGGIVDPIQVTIRSKRGGLGGE